MKFSLFNPWPVYGVPLKGEWPVPPRLSQPEATVEGMRRGVEISALADRLGFDYVTVAEHHYHPRQLSPNPLLSAAALAQHLTHAGVAVLGATLPLLNPIRTAEEIAVVDAMTGGNMLIGLFRGTPNELLTYGTKPQETREVFEEAVELILNAWTQPEPFAWVGRHYDYRVVSVWPRPVSNPHPPVLVSANSKTSAEYAARKRFRAGISFAPMKPTAALAAHYREQAELAGWTPAAEDLLHRSFIVVAETDAEAEAIVSETGYGDSSRVFSVDKDYGVGAALRRAIAEGDGSAAKQVGGGIAARPPGAGGSRPHFVGSPETVTEQLLEFVETTGVGHLDLVFNDLQMGYEQALRGAELFGRDVIPRLRSTLVPA